MSSGSADVEMIPPSGIDHLLYVCADRERGMDEIEALLGVRPVIGGQHPQYGTHNALLSLGGGVYFEVMARDPDLPAPERGALFEEPADADSRLAIWSFRAADINRLAATARVAGLGLGPVEAGSRTRPDGSLVTWRLTDPYAMSMGGAIPFLINWGDTPHPSTVAPVAGRLAELVIEHPQAEHVRQAMSVLGADVTVVEGDRYRLAATIDSKNGQVTIR